MSQRILLLNPWGVSYMDEPARELVQRHVRPATTIEVRNLGSAAPALPWPSGNLEESMVAEAQRAQSEGFDGLVINCCGDPHLTAVRHAVDIPVSASTEAAVFLSRSFGKIAILARQLPSSFSAHLPGGGKDDFWHQKAHEYGLHDDDYVLRRVAVPHYPDPETLDHLTAADPERVRDLTLDAMTEALHAEGLAQAKAAVEENEAEAVYFACTFWGPGIDGLTSDSGIGAPILNPLLTAAHLVESAITSQPRSAAVETAAM